MAVFGTIVHSASSAFQRLIATIGKDIFESTGPETKGRASRLKEKDGT